MNPSRYPIDLTEAVTAAARRARQEVVDRYAKLYPDAEVLYTFDELHITEQNDYREQVLPLIWAAHRDIVQQTLRGTAERYRAKAEALSELPNLEKTSFHMSIATLLDLADELDRDAEGLTSTTAVQEG